MSNTEWHIQRIKEISSRIENEKNDSEKLEMQHTMICYLMGILSAQERKLVELESTINVIIEDKMNKPIEDAVKTLISSIANKQEKEKLDLSFNERMIREARDSLDTGLPFPSSHGEHFYKYLNALSGAVAQIQRYINNQ